MRCASIGALLALTAVGTAAGQGRGTPRLEGTWRARLADTTYVVVIRPDSSLSFGDQVVRWRAKGDSIFVALGDAWYAYAYRLEGDRLVLSGGDLTEPATLTRIGPATPRADSVPLPRAPAGVGRPGH